MARRTSRRPPRDRARARRPLPDAATLGRVADGATAERLGEWPEVAESPEPTVAEPAEPSEPDAEKLKAHVAEHLKVPATRDEILAACAQTDEFTAGEKAWIAERLTADHYESTEAVSQALGL